jgi:tyrosine-specific transport protein
MLTAFLGVSLCLYSFLADGLKLRETGGHGVGLFLLTFLPPLVLVIFYPGAYIYALSYAGIFCIILLLLLPALMCYFGRRYHHSVFMVPGGRFTQLTVIVFAMALLIHEFCRLFF